MALNYPGPYQLRVFYTCTVAGTGTIQHSLRLNCDLDGTPGVGDPFSGITCKQRVGAGDTLDNVVDGLINVIEDVYNDANADFDYAELWKYEALSFDASYVSTYAIGTPGVDVGPVIPAGQSIFTFRTLGGGQFNLHLMESIIYMAPPTEYADLGVDETAIADYFTADAHSFFWGRDNTYPSICLRRNPGQNEALFRKRYRP